MWRIYSHDKNGVRLKTTPRKLLKALKNHAKKETSKKYQNYLVKEKFNSPESIPLTEVCFCRGTADMRCFIGKVNYHNECDLLKVFQEISQRISADSTNYPIAESLLHKRNEFSHEDEVRLIYVGEGSECKNDIFTFKINPDDLFCDTLFDPRMNASLVKLYELVIEKFGFSSSSSRRRVKKSTLYDAPKGWKFKL